jgi:hypothetical protein
VQRPEYEMAGFGRLDGDGDGFEVSQFTNEQDVGILTKRGTQRVLERIGVRPDLTLIDQAGFVRVNELDRVLNRDDVVVARSVDVVDHRAQRRRLAGTSRPGDQHEALAQLAERQDVLRQAKLVGGQDLRGNDAKHCARTSAIDERVGAKARQVRNLVGEVGIVTSAEFFPVPFGDDGLQQRDEVIGTERRRHRVERLHFAVFADDRR